MLSYTSAGILVVLLSAVLAFIFDRIREHRARQQTQNVEETAQRVVAEARAEAEAVRKPALASRFSDHVFQ